MFVGCKCTLRRLDFPQTDYIRRRFRLTAPRVSLCNGVSFPEGRLRGRFENAARQWQSGTAAELLTPQGCFEGDHVLLSDDRKTGVGFPRCA